jgi:hypothetical protein
MPPVLLKSTYCIILKTSKEYFPMDILQYKQKLK